MSYFLSRIPKYRIKTEICERVAEKSITCDNWEIVIFAVV